MYAQNNADVPFGIQAYWRWKYRYLRKGEPGKELTPAEQKSWELTLGRWRQILEKADELSVPVMVDAEESWIQPAVDELVIQYIALQPRKSHRL